MICSIIKKVFVCFLQNTVLVKPAKLEQLTLLKVRLWLVLEYFRNGNFLEFWYWAPVGGGIFQFQDRNSRWRWFRCVPRDRESATALYSANFTYVQ